MKSHSNEATKLFQINSFFYTTCNNLSNTTAYVSPSDYQKTKKALKPSSYSLNKVTKKKPKKIMLGKPLSGKEKMTLGELKALSRQIKPKPIGHDDIASISRNLIENMYKAKSKLMVSLSKSNEPHDVQIYQDLLMDKQQPTTWYTQKSTAAATVDYDCGPEDDDSSSTSSMSSSTTCSLRLKLVTNISGQVSVVPAYSNSSVTGGSVTSSINGGSTDTSVNNDALSMTSSPDLTPLYTPDYYSSPAIVNMELFLQQPWDSLEKLEPENDVTEDQINSWLQRGGFNDNITNPITMATDQELADLLDFDV